MHEDREVDACRTLTGRSSPRAAPPSGTLLRSRGAAAAQFLIAAEHVGTGKPHPKGYLLAARRLGVPIADFLVFEGSPAGMRAV